MSKYTLHYFNSKGRAETIRWLFAVAKVEYEDKRYSQEEWALFKESRCDYQAVTMTMHQFSYEYCVSETPFGSMPVLELEGGDMIAQTSAITYYLATEFGK